MTSIVAAITEHLGNEAEFAVRSSSTSEDTLEASLAGQHATYYFITPSRIDQAIVDCWMSLWSDTAIAYRRSNVHEIAFGEPVRMAIIVQKMVPAIRSGVAFSRDPIRPDNTDCVIEATWGLGAGLVDGRVNPDHIRVSEAGELKSYAVGDKQFFVTLNPSNSDASRLEEVPKHQATQRTLADEEAEHIANIARQLETLFEGPQDVEWAYAGDELNILQSRAITGMTPALSESDSPLVIFKPLAENFTEPLTPTSCDLYAGVLPRFGKIVGGRFYLELERLRNIVPYQVSDAELIDLALLRRAPDKLKLDRRKLIKLAAAIGCISLIYGATWLRASWLNENGLAKYEALAEALRADPTYDAKKTLQRMFLGRHALEPLGLHMVIVNITAGRYFLFLGMLRALLQRYAPGFSEEQLNKTFHGRQQKHSVDLVREINHLADVLQSARASQDEASLQIEAVIRGDQSLLPAGNEFTIAIEKFQRRFGHRGAREIELAAPRWSESISPLLAMIAGRGRLANHDPQGTHPENGDLDARHGVHLAAMDELHQHLHGWKRWVADHLVKQISKYTASRENTRHYHIMGFALTRQKLLEVEQQLLFTDRVKVAGDIFFLRYAELNELAAGTMEAQEAHLRIRRRRREWARAARTPTAQVLTQPCQNIESATPPLSRANARAQDKSRA